jgi:hypothetical protein
MRDRWARPCSASSIGIGVGLLVNLLVWPPLHDRSAARQVDAIDDRIGALLTAIAASIRRGGSSADAGEWLGRTTELDHDIERAWAVVDEARESGRFNPRRVVPDRMRATQGFGEILDRLEQAVAETRSMARTIRLAPAPPEAWDPGFRDVRNILASLDAVADAQPVQVPPPALAAHRS